MDRLELREWMKDDIPFIKEMLYEAVFWRSRDTKPSFKQAQKLPEIVSAHGCYCCNRGQAGWSCMVQILGRKQPNKRIH